MILSLPSLPEGRVAATVAHTYMAVYGDPPAIPYISAMQPYRDLDLAEKVAYLRRPETYPDEPDSVKAIETHFAWVFLSRRFVYKLKKPVRFWDLDLTTVQSRRANCELEIALNRRLAAETYIGVVALGREGHRLALECDHEVTDWLVKMYRLPEEAGLERQLCGMDTGDPGLVRLLETLCTFYGRTARAPWDGAEYARALKRQTMQYAERLICRELEPDHARIWSVAERQLAFVDRNPVLLGGRLEQGRVRDAHGDLRPEHVFLTDRPQIIDCLEFSAEARQLDAAEELSFLALECERLGRADIGERLLELYAETCADDAPAALLDYYRSRRALLRAFLSAWHVEEDLDEASARRWLDQARWYIAVAESSIERAFTRTHS
jgi:aminoglycoside phosphotransferase family enzyme